MNPQGDPKTKLFELFDHGRRLRKLDPVEGRVAVALLPLVVQLHLAVLESVLLDLPGKVDDNGLIDVLLVLRPG